MIDPNLTIDLAETVAKDLRVQGLSYVFEGKTKPSEYKILKTLAKGGYGEVYVIKKDNKVYALKKVAKTTILKNPNVTCFMNERHIMLESKGEWIVKCHECIQDECYLYYIMDIIPGGDLMGYLSKKDVIPEEEIRFYAAEIFVAIHAMHKQGWIHRDLKPDNILIDREGHIKLGDFGCCIKMVDGKATSSITVGTPDYISPEVLVSSEKTVEYGPEVDFWTMGVILYEMFYGVTPFYSDTLPETYSKISSIEYSHKDGISSDLKDLIDHLLCPYFKISNTNSNNNSNINTNSNNTNSNSNNNINSNSNRYTMEDVKKHPFFKGINWDNIKSHKPPYIPELINDEDISNFVDTEFKPDNSAVKCGFKDFIGFTFDLKNSTFLESGFTGSSKKEEFYCKAESANKMAEIEELNCILMEMEQEKSEKEKSLEKYNKEIKHLIGQLVYKKDDLCELVNDINLAKEELTNVKANLIKANLIKANLINSTSNKDSSINAVYLEEIRNIKSQIERAKFFEKIENVKRLAYWFYKENSNLRNEIKISSENISDTKNVDDLKKQLRVKKTEIREYQQKIDQEISLRRKLEDEIKQLKKVSKNAVKVSLSVVNISSGKDCVIHIENNVFKLDQREANLNNVYVRELKNNELHHLTYKKRALCVKIYFLKECAKSSSAGTRRSLKALEEDLEKETRILKGLNSLISVLYGNTLDEAQQQRGGSLKKIDQLKQEIERAKKSTITEYEVDDSEKVYEFNNHLFYEKTVAKGTLCDHCNEVLYGIVNQAYCCKDCLLVVHKSCYVLGDVSCEMNKAMNQGTNVSIICRSIEEKEILLNLKVL